MQEVYGRTLRRAAEIAGGVRELAARMNVPLDDMWCWTQGVRPIPQEIFLRAVDIVTADRSGSG